MSDGEYGVVVHVAQDEIVIAWSNNGSIVRNSAVRYLSGQTPTVADAVIQFFGDRNGRTVPVNAIVVVAAPVRPGAIPITNSRWYVVPDGLAEVLGVRPVIINDFVAMSWHLIRDHAGLKPLSGPPIVWDRGLASRFCVVGVGAGLGVATFGWDDDGRPYATASEAGSAAFPAASPLTRALVHDFADGTGRCAADRILSQKGFDAIRQRRNASPFPSGGQQPGPTVAEGATACAVAMLEFCSSLVLVFGAWDGVIVTGHALGPIAALLGTPAVTTSFAVGVHARRLRNVPICIAPPLDDIMSGAAYAISQLAG